MAVAAAAQGLATGVGMGVGYGILSQLLNASAKWVGWNLIPRDMKVDLLSYTMQTLLNSEKDPVSGLSTKGQIDTMLEFINKTVDFSVWIGEGIASQLFVQMIQQSISYAIHGSHAGSIGTIANVYSGGMYLSGNESTEIGRNIDLVDRATRGFLSAEVGQNVPTLAFNLSKGANSRINEVYARIMGDIDSLLSEWNDLALSYYRNFHSMALTRFGDAITMKESVVAKAYGMLESVANEHLSRITEQLDTIEGANAWFEADFLTSDELKDLALKVDIEREASEDSWEEFKDDILTAIDDGITEWDIKINQALSDLQDNELQYSVLITQIFNSLFADVFDFVNVMGDMCDKALEDVCAYRNMKRAIEVKTITEIGVAEHSPEVEVYHLSWGKVQEIDAITIISAYDLPRGRRWTSIEEEVKVDTVPTLPPIGWVEVTEKVVVDVYSQITDKKWVDA